VEKFRRCDAGIVDLFGRQRSGMSDHFLIPAAADSAAASGL
jgi:hypothetical protein